MSRLVGSTLRPLAGLSHPGAAVPASGTIRAAAGQLAPNAKVGSPGARRVSSQTRGFDLHGASCGGGGTLTGWVCLRPSWACCTVWPRPAVTILGESRKNLLRPLSSEELHEHRLPPACHTSSQSPQDRWFPHFTGEGTGTEGLASAPPTFSAGAPS